MFVLFLLFSYVWLVKSDTCVFSNLRLFKLDDYQTILTDSRLIINYEPNYMYLNTNITLECYLKAHMDNGKSCPQLFNNQSYNNFFLYKLNDRYLNRFRHACRKLYRGCFAIENYNSYDRSFFDCHDDQSDIFVYTGSETLIKIEEKHLQKYSSKRTNDAILYKVSPNVIMEEKQFLYKVTLTENEMVSHDANICHSVIVHQFPIKRIVCLYD